MSVDVDSNTNIPASPSTSLPPQDPSPSVLSLGLARLKRGRREGSRAVADQVLGIPSSVFRPERNVSQIAKADRVSVLIDADNFYRAFAEAIARAERDIFIVGWDTDTRTELPWPKGFTIHGSDEAPKASISLGDLLCAVAKQKPELKIHVLSWDYVFIYLFERESLPSFKFSTLTDDRIRFVLDREHPALASHHQKLVVVDDRVAFSGGMDLTQRRWDTQEHKAEDARRVDPGGHTYGPFHDVQICVEGDAAKAIGEIVRERWKVATGEEIAPSLLALDAKSLAHWPPSAEIWFEDVEIGVSRTLPLGYPPASKRKRAISEVEKLFLDSIANAHSHIYIENQYFTSAVIAKALAEKLKDPAGPEIVLVLPRDQTGWIEESTMGLLRSEALRIVEKADRFGRFRAYHPIVPGLETGYVKIHSKVMIIDDVFLRVGSANLNNRSMGLDTECDLSLEALGRKEVSEKIAKLRAELLGEHLGVSPEDFEARFQLNGSLVGTVESYLGSPRTLIPMHPTVPAWVRKISPPKDWIDPKAPKGIRRWATQKIHSNRHVLAFLLIALVSYTLFALTKLEGEGKFPDALSVLRNPGLLFTDVFSGSWSWTRSWNAEKISSALAEFRQQHWAVPAVIGGFIASAILLIPISAIILGVALTYPVEQAIPISIFGALASALVMYGIGRYWAWSKSRVLNQPWAHRLSHEMSKRGVWPVAAVRLMPIAPFIAVGIVAGGLRLPLRNYILGTLLGILPGVCALSFLGNSSMEFGDQKAQTIFVWIVVALFAFSIFIPRAYRFIRDTRLRSST